MKLDAVAWRRPLMEYGYRVKHQSAWRTAAVRKTLGWHHVVTGKARDGRSQRSACVMIWQTAR